MLCGCRSAACACRLVSQVLEDPAKREQALVDLGTLQAGILLSALQRVAARPNVSKSEPLSQAQCSRYRLLPCVPPIRKCTSVCDAALHLSFALFVRSECCCLLGRRLLRCMCSRRLRASQVHKRDCRVHSCTIRAAAGVLCRRRCGCACCGCQTPVSWSAAALHGNGHNQVRARAVHIVMCLTHLHLVWSVAHASLACNMCARCTCFQLRNVRYVQQLT